MTNNVMNPQHFGSGPGDIQIRINPEIYIRIPDHFRLTLDSLAEVCTVRVQSNCYCFQLLMV